MGFSLTYGLYSIMPCTGEKLGEISHGHTLGLILQRRAREKQISEGYAMLSQPERPSYSESLNWKTPKRRESRDPNGKRKKQRLSSLTMVTDAHGFPMVLLRLTF